MTSELFEAGLKVRKEVLGEDYVSKAMDSADDFNRSFQELVTEYCWGHVWSGGVLERKQRSMLNLCMLAALNRPQEFETHFKGALTNGCTLEELRDVLHQITVYCGVPAGVDAFRIARKVLEARKEQGGDD